MTAQDKRMTAEQVVAELEDGMTIGIGGWGSRRKPMALVRAILRSPLRDLTLVSYGGPDVGLLCAAGKVRQLVSGFVTLDSIPLEPNFRRVREAGGVDSREIDEGMLQTGLRAAAERLPFLPLRAGLGSSVLDINPELRTVRSPYDDGEELLAMPALGLDAALVHMNRADVHGNAQFLGPDLYFDDLFCLAATRRYVSCEAIVRTSELLDAGSFHTLRINRQMVDGVIETPNGAHFTTCEPDYGRDEAFQRHYAQAVRTDDGWAAFRDEFLAGDEDAYQRAVARFHAATRPTEVTT